MRNSSETCKQDSFRKEDWDEDILSLVSETAMFIKILQYLSRFLCHGVMLPLRQWVAWSSSKDDKCTHTPWKKRENHKIARWRIKFDRSLILCENNPIDKIDTIKFNITWGLQIIKALSFKCCVPLSRDQSGSKVSETSRVFILLETFIDLWRVMSGI